jgi:superfamily II DNA or RNA helicase
LALSCWRRLQKHDRAVFVLPTGCGKTFVSALVADAHLDQHTADGLVLFVCPTRELARQQRSALKRFLPPHRLVTLVRSVQPKRQVIVGTAGAIVNWWNQRAGRAKMKEDSNSNSKASQSLLLILDECHHCHGNSEYVELLHRQRSRTRP